MHGHHSQLNGLKCDWAIASYRTGKGIAFLWRVYTNLQITYVAESIIQEYIRRDSEYLITC